MVDCPHIPELRYGEFSLQLHDKILKQRIPAAGALELTFRCNLRCAHCYAAHGHEGIPGQHELTFSEICGILDQVTEAGCLWLLLTGGEPLLRPDFLDIYLYAKRKGLILNVFTNGTLLTPRIADTLAEWRPFVVEISLYGRTQETYERITGVPGSHARCLRGIELLVERGIPLKLKTMLMTLNQHELGDMKAYAESLDVPFRFDPGLNGTLEGCLDPTQLRLTPEEIVALDRADPVRWTDWQDYCRRMEGLKPNPEYLYICGAGQTSFNIDPYGQLSGCVLVREPSYDLRQGSFREGWEFLRQMRQVRPSERYQCNECELIYICGQCPGWATAEYGDQEKPVEFLCQLAHLRADAFGFGSQRPVENSPSIQN
ncbi:MAG: radical SAM protein [Chloroflexi bacterium]|nr:radical SAM protein [Chloroflexota bacterium]MBU1751363.1 radical SAM protein [Chloroflexota bacterium]